MGDGLAWTASTCRCCSVQKACSPVASRLSGVPNLEELLTLVCLETFTSSPLPLKLQGVCFDRSTILIGTEDATTQQGRRGRRSRHVKTDATQNSTQIALAGFQRQRLQPESSADAKILSAISAIMIKTGQSGKNLT